MFSRLHHSFQIINELGSGDMGWKNIFVIPFVLAYATANGFSIQTMCTGARKKNPESQIMVCPLENKSSMPSSSTVLSIRPEDEILDVVRMGSVVVLYVTASWCAPCKKIYPRYVEMSQRASPRMLFATVDVDEHPNSCSQFRVTSVPTLLVFVNGKISERIENGVDTALETLVARYDANK